MARDCHIFALPLLLLVAASAPALLGASGPPNDAPWYVGIDSVKVFAPGDDVAGAVWSIYREMQYAQFSTSRYAVLLQSGNYGNLQIPLGYYTTVAGVGTSRDDVTVQSFYSNDGVGGQATENFWRSVEGVTATASSIAWATSQACPLRRSAVTGDLQLSQNGWSSGGFLGDVIVGGALHTGTQQQFLFRNSRLGSVEPIGGWNFVFVGTEGAPASIAGKPSALSVVGQAPVVAEKPYLVERGGQWWIAVPPVRGNSIGPSDTAGLEMIPMSDVHVARLGDSAASINAGIAGKRGLLVTPAIYGLDAPIQITQPGFVVLGLGFPTLVPHTGASAIIVSGANVRLAALLLESGTAKGAARAQPLLHWTGNDGVLSDIFTRAGAFHYSTGFHASCALTRADVHVQLDGPGTVVDNSWFWHADHDDCGRQSDNCYSGNGLLVHASRVTIYGLKIEHMMSDLVAWYGDDGQMYFYQSELPYHDLGFGAQGFVGYRVDYGARNHRATGLGVYAIGSLRMPTAIRAPPTAQMKNMLAWAITGNVNQFASVICTAPGQGRCFQGDHCIGGHLCYLSALPSGPGPSPSPAPGPSPGPRCRAGDSVRCPGSAADCKGRECCPDGSICPSAPAGFTGCPKKWKDQDCTRLAARNSTSSKSSDLVEGVESVVV